jgi:hypothetical protein
VLTLRLLACATLLAGCDIVFSVDEVAPAAGHPVQVTGALHRRVIENDPSDVPVVSGLVPPTLVTADVAFADGTKQDLAFGADGEFTFTSPDASEPYTITLRSPLTEVISYQLRSPSLQLVERVAGRGDRQPVPPSTLVHVTFPSDTPPGGSTYLELESTGIWTRRFMASATVSQPFDWGMASSLGGPIGMLESGPDAMFFIELSGSTSTFFGLTRYGIQHQPGLVAGVDNAMPFDLVSTVPDKCASITVDQQAEIKRLQALDPAGVQVGWYVFMAPAVELLTEIGFPIALRNLGAEPSPFSETLMFENPFEGLSPFAMFEVATLGAAPVRTAVAVPLDGTCAQVPLPTAVVKIAHEFTVGGTQLTTAGQSVPIDRSKLVPIGFTPTETGDAHYYIILIRDATSSAVLRARIVSTEPRVLVDPDLLLPARSYTIAVQVRIGLPNAANGDFETVGPFSASSIATSTTFRVE